MRSTCYRVKAEDRVVAECGVLWEFNSENRILDFFFLVPCVTREMTK
jgi:hypothetical protein